MAQIYLIRHGQTAGNLEHRYVGVTDEPLCEEGIKQIHICRELLCQELAASGASVPTQVYVSPMLRCRQSAELLFPNASQNVIEDLREMDFGEFEYKNYAELEHDMRYQAFIDSGGGTDFPGGEQQQQFRKRVNTAFKQCIKKAAARVLASEKSLEPFVFLVHGGTIMASLEAYGVPHRNYFDWQVSAASGYCCELELSKKELLLKNIRVLGE